MEAIHVRMTPDLYSYLAVRSAGKRGDFSTALRASLARYFAFVSMEPALDAELYRDLLGSSLPAIVRMQRVGDVRNALLQLPAMLAGLSEPARDRLSRMPVCQRVGLIDQFDLLQTNRVAPTEDALRAWLPV